MIPIAKCLLVQKIEIATVASVAEFDLKSTRISQILSQLLENGFPSVYSSQHGHEQSQSKVFVVQHKIHEKWKFKTRPQQVVQSKVFVK